MEKEYLVLQLARMGDLLQSKRLILSLEQTGAVWLVVDHSLKELAGVLYPRTRVLSLPAHAQEKSGNRQTLEDTLGLLQTLRQKSFDLVFNLNFSGLNFALARLFPPESVQGYYCLNGQPSKTKWTRLAFHLSRFRRDSPINLFDLWALHAPQPITPLQVNPYPRPGGKNLGVVISGRNPRRSIAVGTLRGLLLAMLERTSSSGIVLLGGSGDRPKARELINALPAGVKSQTSNLTGQTNWDQLLGEIRACSALLTPDTGPMHLGAHMGIPVWSFFLSSAWCFETGPYGKGHKILQTVPVCAPCLENRPCRFDLCCHDLLADNGVLRFLLGNTAQLPEKTSFLQSDTDQLGTWYQVIAGEDPNGEKRRQLRRLLLGYRYPEMAEGRVIHPDTAARLLPEREWMLPD